MRQIVFTTGNKRKLEEATSVLGNFNIDFRHLSIDIDEIQHADSSEITRAKARAAYKVVGEPVVVSDTSWSIPALGGFPGGYMKDVAGWWQPEDWISVMSRHEDKSILCHEHVAYFDGDILQHFSHSYRGEFVGEPRGLSGGSAEKVISLYGNMTISEMHDSTGIASAGETIQHWQKFAEWFTEKV